MDISGNTQQKKQKMRRPFYKTTCRHCGHPLYYEGRVAHYHQICYHEMRRETPSQQGYQLLEFLEGFPEPVREIDIVNDMGMRRGQVWKCATKLMALGYATRGKKGGYRITAKGMNELARWRETRT